MQFANKNEAKESNSYKLIHDKSQVMIIKFAKPPLLYSLKPKEGHRLFVTEEDFCKWISSLMTNPLTKSYKITPDHFSDYKNTFHTQVIANDRVCFSFPFYSTPSLSSFPLSLSPLSPSFPTT